MAAILPGGGAFLDRLDRSGFKGVVGEGEETSESCDGLRRLEGGGGLAWSSSKLFAIEREVLFMAEMEVALVADLVRRGSVEILGGTCTVGRARTGSTDGITAAARFCVRASLCSNDPCKRCYAVVVEEMLRLLARWLFLSYEGRTSEYRLDGSQWPHLSLCMLPEWRYFAMRYALATRKPKEPSSVGTFP